MRHWPARSRPNSSRYGLDPGKRLETWNTSAAVLLDQQLWNELVSLRFLDGPHGALLLGPVGVGKQWLGPTRLSRPRRTVQRL
jgi:DNA replication protein DnaC